MTQPVKAYQSGSGKPTLTVVRTVAGIEELEPHWRSLELRCHDSLAYFQGFDWCCNWARQLAAEAAVSDIRVLAVWSHGRLAAVLPLMVSRLPGGVRTMTILGEPHTQYASMLADPALFGRAEARLVETWLRDPGRVDSVNLDLVPETSVLAGVLGHDSRVAGYDNHANCLDLSRFRNEQQYLQSLEPKKRRKRDKRRKRLEKLGPVTLRAVWPGDPAFAGLVDKCIAMKKNWLAETGRVSRGFAFRGYGDFLKSLPGDPGTTSGLVALVLEAGDRVVAIELSMIHHGRLYAYIGGFDWSLRNLSPGKVQMEATVCWAIANGLKGYDLLGNVADYKQDWSNTAIALNAFTISCTTRGWLFGKVWLHQVRPALKTMLHALPAGVRRLLVPAL